MNYIKNSIDNSNNEVIRFHTPGHSGSKQVLSYITNVATYDITELEYSDNLLNSTGCILQNEFLTAQSYGFKYCLYLTQGATSGVFCSLMSVGEKILYIGSPHKSFFNACKMLKKEVVELTNISQINETVSAIFITTPDYLGKCLEGENVIKKALERNIQIIEDNSHGSHFHFLDGLKGKISHPTSICILSVHKTLPALTSAAILLTNNKKHYQKLRQARETIHTTSPNYLILMSIQESINSYIKDSKNLIDEAKSLTIKLKEEFREKIDIVNNFDATRLVIQIRKLDVDRIYSISEDLSIYFEGIIEDCLIFILTPYNIMFKDSIFILLRMYFSSEIYKNIKRVQYNQEFDFNRYELVEIDNSFGRILEREIGIYPPGQIVCGCGECITTEDVDKLNKNKKHLYGLINGKILVKRSES